MKVGKSEIVQNYHWFRCAARWERIQNRIWAIGRSCSLQCYPKSVMKLCCGFLLLVLVFDTAVYRLMSMGIRFNIENDNCIGVARNIYSHFVVGNNVQLDFHTHTQWSVGTLFKHSSINRHTGIEYRRHSRRATQLQQFKCFETISTIQRRAHTTSGNFLIGQQMN